MEALTNKVSKWLNLYRIIALFASGFYIAILIGEPMVRPGLVELILAVVTAYVASGILSAVWCRYLGKAGPLVNDRATTIRAAIMAPVGSITDYLEFRLASMLVFMLGCGFMFLVLFFLARAFPGAAWPVSRFQPGMEFPFVSGGAAAVGYMFLLAVMTAVRLLGVKQDAEESPAKVW